MRLEGASGDGARVRDRDSLCEGRGKLQMEFREIGKNREWNGEAGPPRPGRSGKQELA